MQCFFPTALFISAVCITQVLSASETLLSSLNYYEIIRINRRIVKRSTNSVGSSYTKHERLLFSAFNRQFDVHLSPKRGLLHSQFSAHTVDEYGNRKPLYLDPDEYFDGHVHDAAKDSRVALTFDDDGALLGIIELHQEVYVFEPARLHGMNRGDILTYRSSDMKLSVNLANGIFCANVNSTLTNNKALMNNVSSSDKRSKRSNSANGVMLKNRCSVRVVADHLFFNVIGNGSEAFSARYLINVIDRINILYTTTDWGVDDEGRRMVNMGFMIKDMLVHSRATVGEPDHYNAPLKGKRNVEHLLGNFSRQQGSGEYCLVHLFTAQPFENGVLGLGHISSPDPSAAGGICSRMIRTRNGEEIYYNTALSSAKTTQGGTVITREADLVTAHEFGHNWGAVHDDFSSECSPSYSQGGSFIMHTFAVSGYDANNNRFSPCSLRMIAKVLSKKAEICFEEETTSFCGNGRVEEGEQCDVGMLLYGQEDNCCTSNCRFREDAQCSPKNVPCCSNECHFLPATHLCLHENPMQCKHSSYCTGKSGECPQPQPIEDGRECVEEGECLNGRCLTFCERPSINKKPCICRKVADSCLRCCRSENGTCEPYERSEKYILRNGTRCIHGYCQNAVCIKEVTDVISHFWQIIENIDETNFWKFVEDNVVGLVISATLVIWVPISWIVHKIDKKREARSIRESFDRRPRVITNG